MSQTAADSVANAGHPFSPTSDEQNPPDLILRSSDLVDFYVHKDMLSFRWTFLKNMLAFPEPRGESANPTKDGLPLVILPEPSVVLELLLVLCYPRFGVGRNLIRELGGLDAAYEAAEKYDISGGKELIEAWLVDPRLLQTEPYRVFAIACHRGLEHVAKLAAMATLTRPPFDPSVTDSIPEFKAITAHHLCRLQIFHHRCCDMLLWTLRERAAAGAPDLFSPENDPCSVLWWEEESRGHVAGCGAKFHEDEGGPLLESAAWFRLHLHSLEETCVIHHDSGWIAQKVAELSPPVLMAISKCPRCVEYATNHLKTMGMEVEVKANQKFQVAVAQISFTV
ncbi:hypothetical protein GGX14DRAFT_402386 [Mycena pura]|uniref:BTB domain-containing protein n=1 Tax=Mycena pura TaxID=153505 RepID=A0AAD6UYV8_9AGAR|nr:hypothetical protein GGX14DRAFT_402386 [Mycena pura]